MLLDLHYNEAFSSLRIEGFKNFLRFHITTQGDLEVCGRVGERAPGCLSDRSAAPHPSPRRQMFVIGCDRVPRAWKRDPAWTGGRGRTFLDPSRPSYAWDAPSKWMPDDMEYAGPRLVDKVVVRRNPREHLRRYSF